MKCLKFLFLFFYTSLSSQQVLDVHNIEELLNIKQKIKHDYALRNNNIIVNIYPGIYRLEEPLIFNKSDGGNQKYWVKYHAKDLNNKPVFCAGKPINNWTLFDANKMIWQAHIGTDYSRQIYQNDVLFQRAKAPVGIKIKKRIDGFSLSGKDAKPFLKWLKSLTLNQKELAIKDLEITATKEWRDQILTPIKIKNKELIIDNKIISHVFNGQFKKNHLLNLQNCYFWLKNAGDWYIDRSDRNNHQFFLVGQNRFDKPQNIILPNLQQILICDGAENLIFEGIDFRHTNWTKPSEKILNDINHGLIINQSDVYIETDQLIKNNISGKLIDGGIVVKNSKNITFSHNVFQNMGGVGLQYLENTNNCKTVNNLFKNIAASGLTIGHNNHLNSNDHLIENNKFSNIAFDYKSSIPIIVYQSKKTKILRNRLEKFPYTGISLGYCWYSDPNFNLDQNIISHNRIDCSQTQLNDLGAIYTLGMQGSSQKPTLIHNNHIINYKKNYGAIYLDQGSTYFEVFNNVVENNQTTSNNKNKYNWLNVSYYDTHQIKSYNNLMSDIYEKTPKLHFFKSTVPKSSFHTIIHADNKYIKEDDRLYEELLEQLKTNKL